jgi:2-methylisocitrate lyase-like PEP mutase family enzyme
VSRVDRRLVERAAAFRELHHAGCFVMPNPWDAGSAHLLASLGFVAIATSSAGFAWSQARRDNGVSLDAVLDHLYSVTAAVQVPVHADFEGGYAIDPSDVGANVAAAAATGIAGLSIEDSTGETARPLFDFDLAVARMRAARRAIDASGTGIVLTGRSEGFLVGRPDLAETIRRLEAYADAGADCLFAPGIRELAHIEAIVRAVAPRPVNVVVGGDYTTVAELAAAGVRRVSLGGGLTRVALTAVREAAVEVRERGTFTALGRATPFAELNGWFPEKT